MRLRSLLPLVALLFLQACGRDHSDIRDQVLAAPEKGLCSLDAVNGRNFDGDSIDVTAGYPIRFVGWAADSTKKTPSAVTVVLQNERTGVAVEGKLGTPRNDVAQSLNAPAAADSGFTADGTPNLDAGTYSIVLLLKGSSREERCETHRNLKVRASSTPS